MISSQAQAVMLFKDQAGHLDELEYIGSNSGGVFISRYMSRRK